MGPRRGPGGSSKRGDRLRDEPDCRTQHTQPRQQRVYLIAPMLATQAPLAEVLTVVRQQPIAILPYPGARPFDHLPGVKIRGCVKLDPHTLAAGESIHRDFFDRSPVQATCKSGVMNDPPITHIDSVMQIAAAA